MSHSGPISRRDSKGQARAAAAAVVVAPDPVFAVYPGRRFVPLRLQLFLKAVSAWQSPFWQPGLPERV